MKNEDNRFELMETRFHLKEKNVFVFKGIYSKNKMGDNQVVLAIDGKKIPLKMKVTEGVEIRRKYAKYPYPVNREYSYFGTLPETAEGRKWLEIYEYAGDVKRRLHRISERFGL